MTALDEAIAEESGDIGRRGPTQADILIDLAQSAELFHAPDGTGFADLDVNGHRETWPIRAKGLPPLAGAPLLRGDAGRAEFRGTAIGAQRDRGEGAFRRARACTSTSVSAGSMGGSISISVTRAGGRSKSIQTGWRVIDNPPVRFRRAAGMQPLPVPVRGGSVERLRPSSTSTPNADFVLVVAWALAALRNRGPYPVMVLAGEQGSAKSTFSAILRSLLDPNTAPLRALPREDRDLFIAASNGHVLAFDNVSGLPAWISDTLCRFATGGGFAVRQLYTDQDEVLFDAARPVILNGIEEIVTRPDLADRALFLTLDPIPEERRRPEAELWAEFEAERPRILGALLDAVVEGLKRLPETRLEKLPRMADFALWATACETALGRRPLWPTGTFWAAYSGNRDEAVEGVIDADPIATAVRAVMAKQAAGGAAGQADGVDGNGRTSSGGPCRGSGERVAKSKTWPDSPRALAGRLRRAATFLRKIGIEIGFGGRDGHGPAPSTSRRSSLLPRQKSRGHNRPHRPHRPRPRRNPTRPMASRLSPCGRSPPMRTVAAMATLDRPRQTLGKQCWDHCGRCGRKSCAAICTRKNVWKGWRRRI